MNGLMMDSQLTITSIMKHADLINGKSEIVSVTGDNPLHRYTYKDASAVCARWPMLCKRWVLKQETELLL